MRAKFRESSGDSVALRDSISRWLSMHLECLTVAIFAALPSEPDLLPLVKLHPECRWVLPRVQGESLLFHRVMDPEYELISGAYSIREPRADSPLVITSEIDVFLCPGLAFDPKGNRLGRGRGYYDRMLEKARPNAQKLGICFPYQLVADTFAEPHDSCMDEVISA